MILIIEIIRRGEISIFIYVKNTISNKYFNYLKLLRLLLIIIDKSSTIFIKTLIINVNISHYRIF